MSKEDLKAYKEGFFSIQQAKVILDFVLKNADSVELIIIHCDAGISRSAGVAAALHKILNGDDQCIFKNPRFIPNRYVYRTILETYYTEGVKDD